LIISAQLLTIFFIAAIKGTDGPKYYEKLMSLEEDDQAEIAQVVRKVRIHSLNLQPMF